MAPKTPQEIVDAIVRNLPDRTGKSLDQWVKLLKSRAAKKTRKERVVWLREKHGLGGPTATVIAAEAEGTSLAVRRW